MDQPDFDILKALLKKRGTLRIRIVSDSMLPVIQVGQEIDIKPVSFDELRRFLPIVFLHRSGQLYCHFVWHLNHVDSPEGKRVVLTRGIPKKGPGDNIDMPVAEPQILGQTSGVEIPWWTRLWIILFKSA